MTAPALGAAFGAGLLTFLSPCVLPLIPGYLSFISGRGIADIRAGRGRARILARTAAFAAGFTVVFVLLALAFSGASLLVGGGGRILSVGAGLLVVLLGFNILFDFIKVLDLEARFHPKAGAERTGKPGAGLLGAFLLGIAFAAGWSPCVGPILASILIFASREGNVAHSILLLGAYSLGLALPFLAAGAFFERLTPLMSWFKRHARGVRIVSGLLLVALGAIMALGRLGAISALAARAGFSLKEALLSSPGLLRAAGAAFWALLAAATIARPYLRRREAADPQALPPTRRRPSLAWPRIAFAVLFALAAAAEAAGLWSTAGILSEWLLFTGG